MANLATKYAKRPNPYRQQAERLGKAATGIQSDPYGYGDIARIPIMALYGQASGQADRRDKENIVKEEENVKAQNEFIRQNAKTEDERKKLKSKFDIMSKVMGYVNEGNTGSAVQMANMFKNELGLPENMDVSSIIQDQGEGPSGKNIQVELTDTKTGGKQFIAFDETGKGVWSHDTATNKYVPMTEEIMATLGTKPKDQAGKIGSTKERIIAKISEVGYDGLTANEQEAWDLQSNIDKTIALEVLKTLRVSEEFKALNDENDPDGSKREAMVASATETVRTLFNDPTRTQPDETIEVPALGQYADRAGDYRDIGEQPAPGAAQTAAAPAAPTDTQPDLSQAKRAPDGKLYLPDPNRPGKYLLVGE